MPQYLSLAQIKTELAVPGSAGDGEVLRYIDAAESAVRHFLGYDPAPSVTATEYYAGDGTPVVVLRRRPVAAVSLVEVDPRGRFGAAGAFAGATLAPLTDYTVDYRPGGTAAVYRVGGVWPLGLLWGDGAVADRLAPRLIEAEGCVRVTYATACDCDPLVAAAVAGEVKALWAMRLNAAGRVDSESFDGRSLSLTPFAPGGTARQRFASPLAAVLLAPLQRIAFGRGN